MKRLKRLELTDLKIGDRLKPKPFGCMEYCSPEFYTKYFSPFRYLTVKKIYDGYFHCEETDGVYHIEYFLGILDEKGELKEITFDKEDYVVKNIINAFDFEKFSNNELQRIIEYMTQKYWDKEEIDKLKEFIENTIKV